MRFLNHYFIQNILHILNELFVKMNNYRIIC